MFSSTDLRGLDFSERKGDGLDIQKTLEVGARGPSAFLSYNLIVQGLSPRSMLSTRTLRAVLAGAGSGAGGIAAVSALWRLLAVRLHLNSDASLLFTGRLHSITAMRVVRGQAKLGGCRQCSSSEHPCVRI